MGTLQVIFPDKYGNVEARKLQGSEWSTEVQCSRNVCGPLLLLIHSSAPPHTLYSPSPRSNKS